MPLRYRASLWPVLFAAAAASCSSDNVTLPSEGLPAAIVAIGGGGQTAVVATPLPESLTVRVTDSKSRPVEGIKVVFTPTLGGGDAIPDTALTNADGRTGSRWLLGTTAGAQRMQAMVVGATASGALALNFDATARAGAADTVFVSRGNGQSAVVGGALTDSLVVKVTDRYGNAVSGSAVSWSATGGGSVSPAAGTTGATGTAATARVLGATAGPQGASATAAGLKGSPVVFTMTATPAAPASLIKVSGDNQTAAVGTVPAESLVVRLLDGSGNGVPGRNVTFAVATGGGTTSPTSATTDATGRAASQWKLGSVAGGNSLIASSSGFSVTFQATGTAALPTTLLANSPVTQSDTAGLPAASSPSVKVTDASGNPVAGVSVAFAVASGGGSILPTTPLLTDALGVATLTSWTLGTVAGGNAVTATVAGLSGSPMTFSATGVAGAPAQLQIQTQPSPSAQSGVAFAVQPVIRLADVFGNAVATNGAVITAALASGTGTLGGTLTATTTAGVAAFSSLAITGVSGTYTVRFTSGALTQATSAGITIGAGAATKLAMVTQPSTTAVNTVAFVQQPTVQVQDAAGNPVAGVVSVTAAILTGGGTLGGTATVSTNAAGLATFAGLSITGTVGTRTLTFSSAGLTNAVSGNVAITAGAPTQMAVQAGNGQTATAGSTVPVAPSVVVRDVSANPVSGVAVTFAVASGGGSVLPVAAVTTNASGIAAATSWTLGPAAGANTLTADAAPVGIAGDPVTFTATGVSGGAGRLGIITQPPSAATNGVAFTQAPVIQLQDVNGNAVTTAGIAITVAIASGPGGTLAGLTTVGTDGTGRATFSGLSITGLAGSYTLQFTGASLTGVTSAPVVLSAGAATQLRITTEPPASAQSGVAMAPAAVVQLQDVSGNPVSTASVSVAAALLTGGGTLTGTLSVPTNASGAASFANLILTGTIGPRTIRFTATGVTPDTSAVITLAAGTPTALEYVAQPSAVVAGQAISPAVTVRVRDGAGNTVTTATNTVTMGIGTNPGGSTLGGTTTANAVAGVATFGTLTLNKAGAGYTLVASATGLTSATSTAFTVTAAGATTIAASSVTSQTDTAGLPAAAPPSVLVTDAGGNPVAGVSVTFAATGGGGSVLPVTAVATNASGIAALTSWTLGGVAGSNTVTATAAGLTGSPVTFTATGVAGVATQLQIQAQPSSAAQSGVAFAVQPAVRVADAFGNTVPASGTVVTAALASGTGTLGGTLTASTVTGVATFTNLSITGVAGSYTLQFTSTGLTPVTSGSITIGAGAATKLVMGTQPSATAVNGVAFSVQPTVQLQDAASNPVASGGIPITVAITGGLGTLGGVATVNTNAAGLATFAGLSITGTVGPRTLVFTSGALTQVTSGTITLSAGPATQIAVNVGNAQSATVNTAVATPPSVVVRDVSGNLVSGVSVSFAVVSGGGTVLPVTPILTNASGVAALTSWTMGTLAGANSITATSGTLAGSPVTFTATGTAGAATQLVIQTQPSAAAQSGVVLAAQPVVRLADAFGNLVTTSAVPVAASFASGTGTLGGTTPVATVSGVATFANLSVTGVAGSYTLQFTSAGLVPDTSTAIVLGAGTATKVVMGTQPSATAVNGVAFPVQPTVQLQDAASNPVALGGVVVTAAIQSGGGALGGLLTATTNAAGLATFTNLAITGLVGPRTLVFTSGALTQVISGTVTTTAGAAKSIAINAGNTQSATVNTPVAIAPSVVVRDTSGNAVSGVSVTFAVAGGGGSILPVTAVLTNTSGVAALTSWTMGTAAGPNSISATSTGLTGSPLTFTATGTAGAATLLQVVTQPSSAAQSGVAFATQPAVRLADAFGNLVATNAVTITAAIASGTGTLAGTATASTSAGVATFTNLAINGTAGAYTLGFSSTGLTGVTSAGITISAGTATKLAIVVQPSATAQNAIVFAQQPQVQVQDAAGNPVAGVVSVGVTILTGGGALAGTTSISTNAAGLATFTNLAITGAVGPRTLQFTSAGLTAVTSASIALAAGTPTQMAVIAGQGQTATAGSAVAVAPSVVVRDLSSNPVPGVSVTFAVATGGGSVLPATPVTTDASGLASATSWTLGTTAGSNSLTATAAPGGIAGNPITFTATGVSGSAGKLAMFTQPPASAQSGVTLVPVPVVQLQDVNGNPVTTQNVGITVSIASGPGGSLGGNTIQLTDINGRATFNLLSITGPTGAYTLQFNGPSLTGVTSNTITIAAGAAAKVSVVTQPTTVQSGVLFPSSPTVQLQDAAGNPVASAGLNISVAPNSGAAALSGTLVQATNGSGLATFSNLVLTGPVGPNTLLFSRAGLTSDTTSIITLAPGTATALEYVQQPTTVVAGQVISPSPTVRIRDGAGNTVLTATNTVTMAIAANPGSSTLGGTLSVAAVAGVATFNTLTLNRSAPGYTLAASAAGLAGATSSAFTVNPGTATALAITTAPTTGQSGVLLSPQPAVRLVDVNGNPVTTTGTPVTATLASGAGTLGGTLTANTVNGVATFTNLALSGTTGAYTINFSSAALTGVTTGSITLSAGAAASLAFQAQPSTVVSGAAITPAVTVRVLDGAGNLVPTATNSIVMGIGTNPGGAALTGTTTVSAVAGVATFSSLSLDKTGTGYTLAAASTGLTGTTSTAFNVTPGAATKLVFSVQPTTVTAGASISPAVVVQVQDAASNVVTSATTAVTIAIGTNPGGSTLGGTATASAVAGVVTFSTLSLDKVGTGYTLAASSGVLTGATSAAFNVNPGAAAALAVTSQPTTGQSGVVLATPLVVRVVDANGNTVPANGTTVTASLASGSGTLGGTLSAGTVSGTATFTNLVLTGTTGSYTINLSSAALTSATTGAIALSAGAPAAVAFQVQPSNVASGASIAPAVVVRILDGAGNLVPTATNSVTMSIGNNPGSSTLGGTAVATAVAGVATFSNLTLDKTGVGYTLAAASGGLSSGTSGAFNVTPGAATKLVYSVQPATATAGAPISPAVVVQVQDANNNVVTSSSAAVTIAIGANPGTSTLGGTTTVNAVAGVATFSTLTLNKTGAGYTLTASSAGLTGATSAAFTINPGAATALAIITAPPTGQSGVVLSPQPVIRLVDANGNTVPSNSVTITAALASGAGTLGGTLTANTVSGDATFSSLALTGTAGSYTLNFSSAGLTPVTSGAITLSAGLASALLFQVQPSTVAAGAAIAPAVQVRVVDGAGNTVTTATNSVSLALGANPGGSTLGGTTSVAAVAGVATFSTLTLDKAAAGYTLAASATGLTGITSGIFTVNPGAAAALVITTSPATAQSGVALSPQPVVRVVDANGNTVTSSSATVTAFLASGAGTLGGTLTAGAVNGVATFTNLALTGTVGSYAIGFASLPLAGVTSGAIALSAGPAAALAFQVQPATAAAGSAITPAVQVRVVDGTGNLVTTATNTIAVALGANPGASTLGGTTSVAAVGGVASFGTLTLNRAAAGYTLVATTAGLPPDTSATFAVNPGAAAALAITTAPATGQSGVALSPQPVIRIVDANGNTVTSSSAVVTAALASGAGTLGGTLTATAAGGVATFANLVLTGTVGNYTINFTAGALTPVTTGTIAVSAGVPAALSFSTQPTTTVAGASITPTVQVRVLDGAGNLVTTASTSITLAIGTNPGGGTLSGTTTASASSGTAAFPGLVINRTGAGYTLTATGGALTPATSTGFDITPAAASALAFIVQPATVTAGAAIAPPVQVEVRDALGNRVSTSTASVTMAIGTNAGGGTLGGTTTASAVAGVATFSTLTLNRSAAGYTLAASSSGLSAATSSAFTVDPGPAAALAITTMPTTGQSGIVLSPQPVIRVVDANGNTVPTSSTVVTAAIASGIGTLGGTLTATTSNGVATFTNLSLSGTAGSFTLNFSSALLTDVTSGAIALGAGAPAALAFQVQPSTVASGAAISPAVQVRVVDGAGNLVGTATNSVTMAIGTNPVGGVLVGTLSTAAVGGVATFSTLSLDKAGAGYSLAASSTGLTPTTSNPFNVTFGAASKLAFLVQPTTAAAGASITPSIQVAVQDAAGNLVTTASTAITLAIASNPGSSTLGGTSTLAATAGVATFSGMSLNKTGTGYTLGATGGSLTAATSTTFDITPGAASALAFTVQPSAVVAGVAVSPAVVVEVRDALGNRVTAATTPITLGIGTNPGGATLGGAGPVSAVAGVATFGGVTLNRTGTGYTLTAAASGLAGTTSSGFAVTPAAPAALVFLAQPAGAAVGTIITPPVTVRIEDALGNLTASTAAVTLAFGNNPGGATLGGTSSIAAVAGIATFSTLTVNRAGAAYTLVATSTSLAPGTSTGFTITSASTSTVISTDLPDPSVTGQSVAVNYSVTSGGGTPTGNVTVSDGTVSCIGTVAAGSCALVFTTAGTKTITATYTGDANFAGSASAGATHTVNAAATTTAITSNLPDPSVVGQPVTVSYTVTSGGGAPTGNVTVSDGVDSCVGTVASGSCILALTTAGARTLQATYATDGNFAGSTSSGVAQTVNQAVTSITIVSHAPNPSDTLTAVNVTWAVLVSAPGAGTPVGNVTVTTDGPETCTAAAAAGVCSLTFATPGTHSLTATYSGDARFLGSSSGPTPHLVN